MALPQAKIQELPDLACVGTIKEVGPVKSPGEGKIYHTIQISIEGAAGGRDSSSVFCFQPEWFDQRFDGDALDNLAETDKAAGRQFGPYWMYCRTVAHEKGNATLQVLAQCNGVGEPADENGFAKLGEQFDAIKGTMDATTVQGILRDFLLGKEVGYVLSQATEKDADGNRKLLDKYQVNSFFVPSNEGMAYMVKQQSSNRRKRPLIVTWNEE